MKVNRKIDKACEGLVALGGDFVYSPGVLSLMTALYLSVDNISAASVTLSKAVNRLMNDKSNEEVLTTLLEECATLYSRLGDQETALQYLESLKNIKPNDKSILARLMNAYMLIDEQKALK
ncbi:unnamed protein product [Soboliphyme baturini]|uniref:TPR_REGION domain-containing protein n=1 Tax=Soboliphyme baturini TaxID=241478 RepID=A0A183IAP7_9BILA|nr:unnamed protein product [Soboliphyme baturini]